MKPERNIVAGTDFSPCSQNALHFAADLCEDLGARLVVVHGFRVTGRTGALTLDGHVKKSMRKELSEIVKPLRIQHPDLKIDEVVRKGESKDVMLWASEKYKAAFIVVGTQGSHENSEIFIGSTTGSLVKLGNAAVLAIPSNCSYSPFREILFAVKNPHVASKVVIQPFLDLCDHFDSHTTLLHVTKDSMPDLSRFPNPYPIVPHIHSTQISDSDNIYASVQSYFKEHQADLLVVISRLRGFFEGLFAHGATSASTFNAQLPILVLHGSVRE